ncbi:hypothetical protein EDD30_4027 [Couchioplanes caeruleus]|uniref:Uncharacterized protein n=1 Tax=Couchioplanes caeruleus TaxID=56438 RepID=A0A3N1GM05_9ACTN|nr:hypothetical protein EDD30_4027 [Couchioplanes caeruleus]
MALNVDNVETTPTDTGIQRRDRSFSTSVRAAAGMQPKMSARGTADGSPSRALRARHRDR